MRSSCHPRHAPTATRCSRCVACATGSKARCARPSSWPKTSRMLLVIGNKNYSSWSLRSWVALKMLGVPVDKKRIALRRPETKAEILRYSPAGRVPILRDCDTVVWGSLAILEYLAEKRPQLAERPGAARKGAFSGRRSPRSSGKGRMPNHVSGMSAFGRLRTLELLAH